LGAKKIACWQAMVDELPCLLIVIGNPPFALLSAFGVGTKAVASKFMLY
jgi:hypothetical protein